MVFDCTKISDKLDIEICEVYSSQSCEVKFLNRVATHLQNLEKSENLEQNSKSQGIFRLKFIFSQAEDPNFETFLGSMPPDPLNGLGLTVELNLGLEMSGNFILSGK